MDSILSIAWPAQLTLAVGYIAYLIAYGGFRKHHTATDAVFRTFIFGLPATLLLTWEPLGSVANVAFAIAIPIVFSGLWRSFGRAAFFWFIRQIRLSGSDDIPTAWLSTTAADNFRVSEVVVELTDGRILQCERTKRFETAPFGPCIFGLEGDVAMYVDSERRPDGEWLTPDDIVTSEGHRLTHIPAASIRRTEVRYWTKANETACLAAAVETGERGVAEGGPSLECTSEADSSVSGTASKA